MKKIPLALTLIAGLLAGTAHAADGTINITGSIRDTGCTINTSDASQPVPLYDISKSAFSAAGDVAGSRSFSIRLTACPTITSVSAVFDGALDANNPDILAVTGGAVGVGAAIFEADGSTLLPIGNRSAAVPVVSNAATLTYVAKYMATVAAADIEQGGANATAQFTLIYN